MQQLIKNFDFNGHSVRVITNEENQVFFVAKDVCDVLGYNKASSTVVQTHCKMEGVTKMGIPSDGGVQEQYIINEGNLYRLVLKSKKKEAEKFESWVCDEVLPEIRKTGKYEVEKPKELTKKEILLLALESEERALAAEAKLLEVQPKVEAFDRVIDNSTTYTLDTVSDIINVGRNKLSDKLKQIGWAMKDSSKGTSSTRVVEEKGFARTYFETIQRGTQEIKVKKIVITKKGLDYLVNNYSKIFV